MTQLPELNLSVVRPILFAGVGSMVVLMGEVLLSRRASFLGREVTDSLVGGVLAILSMAFLAMACLVSLQEFSYGTSEVFNATRAMVQLDPFSSLVTAVLAIAALLSCGLSIAYLSELRINHGEFYALILLSTCGMMLMVAAIDMLALFLGLELMSIPIYVLAGFDRGKLRSNESALKYFLIGSFSGAVMLYGMALLYGTTGSTSFEALRAGFDASNPMAMMGVALVLVGFAFKVSSVPFHQWTPDVYEGAPAAITAFMSVCVKATAFAALLRLLGLGIGPLQDGLVHVVWVLAAATMVVGNVMAVIQDNAKRLLAYSSIAHAGYVLVGIVAGTPEAYAAVIFYLIVYVFMNLGAFGVLVALAYRGQDCERLESLAGLARTRPGLAAVMSLFMLALAGIPLTAGFMAKFTIFAAAVRADVIWLTILAVLMSVVSVYYYLRIPVLMYMREPGDEEQRSEISSGEALVLAVCAVAVLFLGVFPNHGWLPLIGEIQVLDWTRDAIRLLFPPA